MTYQIAIPSYKRYDTIKSKTIALLNEYSIPSEIVKVFVADEQEAELYERSLEGSGYEKNIVIGVHTIGQQRNFIEKHYSEGTNLMMFDDDIDQVLRKNQNGKLEKIENLEKEVILKGFEECRLSGSKCFGIYAAQNAYFMKHRVYKKLCYIIASMFGVIVNHDPWLERTTNHGEDYEYSIRQYIATGVLCRLDHITVKSNYYKEEGGLQEYRTVEYVDESISRIASMFPEFCTKYTRKSTGFAELRLRDKTL